MKAKQILDAISNNRVNWENLEKGLIKYNQIMDAFISYDSQRQDEISVRNFQKMFNGFYRIRRNSVWQKSFYKLLEDNKSNLNISFNAVLSDILKETGQIEASFCSKLIATINPDRPIWDSIVLKNLGKKIPNANAKNRKEMIISLYNELVTYYNELLSQPEIEECLIAFDKRFQISSLSRLKKIDLILWQIR